MGAINCCEQPRDGIQFQDEIETKIGSTSSDQILRTPKSCTKLIRTSKSGYDKKTFSIVRIQSLLRAFVVKSKFKKRLEAQKKYLHEYFTNQGILCESNDVNTYVHPKVKFIENQLRQRKGVYSNENIPDYILKPINSKSFYSCEMPCAFLVEKDEKLSKNNDADLTSNTDACPSDTEFCFVRNKGPVYKGSWSLNKSKNGYGILVNVDGAKFEGNFRNGKLDGYGRYITVKGDFFEGQFSEGVANGQGLFIHNDGSIYKGGWLNELPHGEGEEWSADGSYYRGEFRNGKKNGIGEFKWKDGSQYLGNVRDDNLNGEGTYTWIDGKRYKGQWLNNEMHGRGLLVNLDGSKYNGQFQNNKKCGYGVYIYNSSKSYEGSWLNGKQHGPGKIIKNDKVEVGEWIEGKRVK